MDIHESFQSERIFFGGNLWDDDSMLTKFHARHMDLIIFDGEASQPATFHRFSSFDFRFFSWANHMSVVASTVSARKVRAWEQGSACRMSLGAGTKSAATFMREGHVVKKVGESVKVKKEIPLSNSCCRCQAETEG